LLMLSQRQKQLNKIKLFNRFGGLNEIP